MTDPHDIDPDRYGHLADRIIGAVIDFQDNDANRAAVNQLMAIIDGQIEGCPHCWQMIATAIASTAGQALKDLAAQQLGEQP